MALWYEHLARNQKVLGLNLSWILDFEWIYFSLKSVALVASLLRVHYYVPFDICVCCRTVSFYLRLGGGDGCDPPDSLDQGLRFEININGSWTPVMFYSNTTKTNEESFVQLINNTQSVHVMEVGYNLTMPLRLVSGSDSVFIREHICGLEPGNTPWRLRWVQYPHGEIGEEEHTLAMDNVTMTYWNGVCQYQVVEWDFEEPSSE